MLIIKNSEGADLTIKVPGDDGDIPIEVTLKPGEQYEVDDQASKNILRWNYDARFTGDPSGDSESDSDDSVAVGEDSGVPAEKNGEDNDEDGTAKTATVENTQKFDVEVKYTDADGNDQTATVKAGEFVNVPSDQEATVKKQIADATDPNAGESGVSEEAKSLAARERALVAKEAEFEFGKLLAEGKVVPAQKESFMGIATEISAGVREGNGKTVSEQLKTLFENAPVASRVKEEGASGDDSPEDNVDLTDEDKQVAEMFGNTEEELKKVKAEEEK